MERIRAQPVQDIVAESPVKVDDSGLPSSNGPFERSVQVNMVDPSLMEVKVVVVYPRGRQPVELVTLVYVPPVPT